MQRKPRRHLQDTGNGVRMRVLAKNIEGLEYHQGYLYYGDVSRRAIFRVPLEDLEPAG
jgi:hypothetical protein